MGLFLPTIGKEKHNSHNANTWLKRYRAMMIILFLQRCTLASFEALWKNQSENKRTAPIILASSRPLKQTINPSRNHNPKAICFISNQFFLWDNSEKVCAIPEKNSAKVTESKWSSKKSPNEHTKSQIGSWSCSNRRISSTFVLQIEKAWSGWLFLRQKPILPIKQDESK